MTAPQKPYDWDDYRADWRAAIGLGVAAFLLAFLIGAIAMNAAHDDPPPEGLPTFVLLSAIGLGIGVAWDRIRKAKTKLQQDEPRRVLYELAEEAERKRKAIVDQHVKDVQDYARRVPRR